MIIWILAFLLIMMWLFVVCYGIKEVIYKEGILKKRW